MITMHTHQSSAPYAEPASREAAWQGCAPTGTGRGCLRTPSFASTISDKAHSLLDTQAIRPFSTELSLGQANPEALP